MLLQKIKMAIYIKSTILKLENSRNMLEIVFLCTPSPHQGHAWAISLVLDQYLHLTEYILVL